VLASVSLEVGAGECVVIGGPSGSGKSTLLGVVSGLLPAWGGTLRGEVLVAGAPVARLSAEDRGALVGYFQQAPAGQFLHPTVRADCAFAPENLGWRPSRIAAAVDEALARFGVGHLADRRPSELSGGEQALVLLASLWMLRPRVLLLDEPLANLDEAHALRLVQALEGLKREGCALLVCEHRDDLMDGLADRRLVLADGRLGPPGPDPSEAPQPAASVRPAATTGPACITLTDLAVSRGGRRLFGGLSDSWRRGELVVLRGPNGAGKSSLLRVLAGLDGANGGTLEVSGSVRLVGQDPLDQLCRPTVRQECALDQRTRNPAQRDETLARVGLAADLERSPFVLSEGGKRRLAVACGLLAGADVLLLDEPTAGLDPASSASLMALVLDFVGRGGLAVCATHDTRWARLPQARVVDLAAYQPPANDTAPPVSTNTSVGPATGPPAARPAPVTLARPPRHFDPRWRFAGFLAAVAVAVFPWPVEVALALFALVAVAYLPAHLRSLGAFLKTLALFWIVPGVVLLLLVGPGAALEGMVRLGLLSLLFHRFFLGVDGKALSVALTRWGVPYAAGFALTAAVAQLPVWRGRLKTIHGLLVLRLGRHRFGSVRAVAYLLVPTVVHVWQQAALLAMNLDLRGFDGKPPEAKDPTSPPGVGPSGP
jgi:energy-coupling factor transport system ATP-binding protein